MKLRLAIGVAMLPLGAEDVRSAEIAQAAAGVRAEIVSPAVASLTTAAELLFSPAPGVLTLRIPGAGLAATIALTAEGAGGGSGAIVFSAPRESAGALRQLIAEMIAAESGASTGGQPSGLATSGVIKGQGVQVVVVGASQRGDGGGTVTAIITYD